MDFGNREKAIYGQNRRNPVDNQQDVVTRKKTRARPMVPHFLGQMEKNYTADQAPYDPAEPYKSRKYTGINKLTSGYPQAMSNDDLYRKIHGTPAGTRGKASADNIVAPRKELARRRGGRDGLSLIPDEDEDEEQSDQDFEPRMKYCEDEEGDDEYDYESDAYEPEPLAKDYQRLPRKSSKFDRNALEQQYQEFLMQHKLRNLPELDKSLNQPKYDRTSSRKLIPKSTEEPADQKKRPQVQRCSDCGKIMESAIKSSAPRNPRLGYEYTNYRRDFTGEKSQKFDEPQDDLPCPKPRKSKTAPRPRDRPRKSAITHSKLDEDYYDN